MQQYIERLMQSRIEVVDEASRKRGLPSEPTDGLDNIKRAKLDAEAPALVKIPPLPPGPTSYAQLFTITEDKELRRFDVKQLPVDMLVKMVVPILARVDQSMMNQSIEVCQSLRVNPASADKTPGNSYAISSDPEATGSAAPSGDSGGGR